MRAMRPRGRIKFSLITLLCLVFLSSCALSPTSQKSGQVEIDWPDFLQVKGIVYHILMIDKDLPTPPKTDLGNVYASVRFQIAGHVNTASYQAKDGDAAYLPVGTQIYTLKSYQPWFRLAVYAPQFQNRLVFYEVSTNPNAKTGRDLFDIAGRVSYMTLNEPRNALFEKGRVTLASQVNSLMAMILAAPLITPRKDSAINYFLELHLKDGTIVSRPYRLDADTFDNLRLPIDFRISLEVIASA